MKHYIDNTKWQFSTEPFPAFRCELTYGGRGKRDRAFLPSKAEVREEDDLLPENKFKVIKTKEKGTILIVPGENTSNRVLLMAGLEAGFRGNSGIYSKGPDQPEYRGHLLAKANAHGGCRGRIEVAIILSEGGYIALYSNGRYRNVIVLYQYQNGEVTKTEYDAKEYKTMTSASEEKDAEAL